MNIVSNIFNIQNIIIWVKSISIDNKYLPNKYNIQDNISIGHFKPINSNIFLNNCYEYIIHATKQKIDIDKLSIGVPYSDKSNQKRWKSGLYGKRCRGNVWFIPYKTIKNQKSDRPHPATFPVELPEQCIKLHGGNNLVVLDPFMGIGSTALAALNCNCSFYGFDIDRDYIEESMNRINGAIDSLREQLDL